MTQSAVPESIGVDTVIILHSSDDLYGADRILLQVLTALDRQRFRPVVVLPDDMKHVGLLSAELARLGIEYQHLPILIVRRRYLKAARLPALVRRAIEGTLAVRRLARETNARLIYGFTFAVIAAPLAALVLKRPLVMHAHELLVRPTWLRRSLHALFVRPARAVVCISDAVKENILGDEPSSQSKLCTVHNGLELQVMSVKSREEARVELQLPLNIAVVGMVGRISAWKGQSVFLAAAALLRDRGIAVQCIAVGGVFDGNEEPRDRLMAERAGLGMDDRFTLIEFRPDARSLLAAMDIFVLPSIEPEPFGMVILEAMEAGVPVIASRAGGPLEIIKQGENGLFFDPGNARSLSEAIETLLSDPAARARLTQAAGGTLLDCFTSQRQVASIESILTRTIHGDSPICTEAHEVTASLN